MKALRMEYQDLILDQRLKARTVEVRPSGNKILARRSTHADARSQSDRFLQDKRSSFRGVRRGMHTILADATKLRSRQLTDLR
jgi:hypothetical protein